MKKILLSSALVLAFGVSSASAQDIISEGNVKVTAKELSLAIEAVLPERTREGMREDEKNIRLFLIDYFTIKSIGDAARKQGIADEPVMKIQQEYNVNRLLSQALIRRHGESGKQPDFEPIAKEAYLADRQRFAQEEVVRAEHILVAINAEQDDAAALAKANNLYAQAKKKGSDFSELAKQHSDDPSAASNSGDLGYFTRDKMVKPFADAAFAMKNGQISKPVKSDFGYHIIHVLERKPATVRPFEEVKDELIEEQRAKYQAGKRREFVDSFQDRDTIVIDDAAFAEFVKEFQQKEQK